MKRTLPFALTIIAISIVTYLGYRHLQAPGESQQANENESHEQSLFVKERLEYEYQLLANPTTGKIPEKAFDLERKEALGIGWRELSSSINQLQANTYTVKGPTNLGGRSRAVEYDVRFGTGGNQVLLAGGVSSGIFRSTNGGTTWTNVTPSSFIHNVTCIAQDTRSGQQDTWYYGTGEGFGNSAGSVGSFYSGNGIYKSTDNGLTWSRLSSFSTDNFSFDTPRDLVYKIAVNPTNGDVYAAVCGQVIRSTDGGQSWEQVLGFTVGTFNSRFSSDVVITTGGRVYAAIGGNVSGDSFDGVWTSATGASGSFTRIANSTTVPGWNAFDSYGRIVLALAPINQRALYALYHNNITHSSGNQVPEAEFFKYTRNAQDDGGTWEDRSANLPDEVGYSVGNDPFAVQGGYDLAIAVYPPLENIVFIGGTNSYRSPDGFATKSGVRIGGYQSPATYAQIANHHADTHWFSFNPSNPNEMMTATDGGISLISSAVFGNTWEAKNVNFITYQYYYGAIEQVNGSEVVIGGAQDNGNTYSTTGSTFFSDYGTGGDGVSVGILPSFYIFGTQNGSIRRQPRQANGVPTGGSTNIRPANAVGSSLFVTLFHVDRSNPEHLYYALSNRIYRTTNASTTSTASSPADWSQLQQVGIVNSGSDSRIRCIKTSHGPYNPATSKMYFGNEGGQVFRFDDPAGDTLASPVLISNNQINDGTVIDIAVHPLHPERVMAVLSNFGIVNIYYCHNTNAVSPQWIQMEGNLTEQSVRSAAMVSYTTNGQETTEYYVGTNTGLYSYRLDNSLNTQPSNNPAWLKEGQGVVNNAVVREIDVRHSDNTLLIVTHGNGMYIGTANQTPLPVTLVNFDGKDMGKTVELQWTADNIEDFNRFEIERTESLDQPYIRIGIEKRASYGSRENFSFTDKEVLGKTQLYYRLKMIDNDGRAAYSKVVAIVRNGGADAVSIYPSVNNGSFSIVTPQVVNGSNLIAEIMDMNGRRIKQMRLANGATAVDITGNARGMYLVRLLDAQTKQPLRTEKIMVQ